MLILPQQQFLTKEKMPRFRRQVNAPRRKCQRRYAQNEYFVLSLRSPVSVLRTGAQVIATENVRLKMVKVLRTLSRAVFFHCAICVDPVRLISFVYAVVFTLDAHHY